MNNKFYNRQTFNINNINSRTTTWHTQMGLKVMAGLTKSDGKYNDQMQMNFFIYIFLQIQKRYNICERGLPNSNKVALAITSQS